jgi:Na+-transporting NADH:ubiquinone oxidoreductase subunit C
MAFSNTYVFGFAATVCLVCSLSLATAAKGLEDIQNANKKRDKQSSILNALGISGDGSAPLQGEAIDAAWKDNVEVLFVSPEGIPVEGMEYDLDKDGILSEADVAFAWKQVKGTDGTPTLLSVYQRKDEAGGVIRFAVPVYGAGLWGPISGYIALDPGGEEILAATFFAPKETPGLGLEITKPKFVDQWPGKRLRTAEGETVSVVKDCTGKSAATCVDGVSGATITSRGVHDMVASAATFYTPYLQTNVGS